MTNAEEIIEMLANLKVDLKMEAILADVVLDGFPLENIMVNPIGTFKRGYRWDIDSVKGIPTDSSKPESISINIHREGLYDYLPEGLFHQQAGGNSKQAARLIERERIAASKFFMPLETEFYLQRIYLEIQERDWLNIDAEHPICQLWDIDKNLVKDKLLIILYMLTLADKISGNLAYIAKCCSVLLGERVVIRQAVPVTEAISNEHKVALGQGMLGYGFVLGGSFNSYIPSIEVLVVDVSKSQVTVLLPGGSKHEILKLLFYYFMPLGIDVNISVRVEESHSGFVLNNEIGTARLSYTSALLT